MLFRGSGRSRHAPPSAIDTLARARARHDVRAQIDSARLKVATLIEYINLTTDVIDQKANSSSIIALEGKTIAK